MDADLDATNWRAEQAVRQAVITRKICGGGNRSRRGADTQQILVSLLALEGLLVRSVQPHLP